VLGGLYLRQTNIPAALESLTTATRLDSNLVAAQFLLGNAYEAKGDTANAVRVYRGVMMLAPQNAEPYNNVAWIFASENRNLDEALSLAQKAIQLSPYNFGILDTLGFVYYQRGDYQKAEPLLKRAAEAGGKNPTVFYHLGLTQYKLGHRDDAAAALRRALQLNEALPQAAEIRALLVELQK
jgi:Tfp pilus assembly protein PilF